MIILIPLGGKGERFKKNNYTFPKALINIFGRPILFWLLDSIKNIDKDTIIYIPYNKEYEFYRLTNLLINNYPKLKFKFFCLERDTEGAAETINIALKEIDYSDQPILCLDSDNFYTFNIVEKWNKKNTIFTFSDYNDNPIYSYINLVNEEVKDIVEKTKISEYACTGAYGFSSYKELLNYSQYILDNSIKEKNEYYTSVVIKEMIKDNKKFGNTNISINEYICLGTPLQLKQFYNDHPKNVDLNDQNNFLKPLRICFDFDNTLVSFPEKEKDYTTVKPIEKNINFLRYIKSLGHTIIIYTARRMKTHNGNTGKVLADAGKITFETLEKFNIPFDEIYFGKPYANFYIDDLAINCFDDMEKQLGFYQSDIEPRKFNSIENNMMETVTKRSANLDGEIYYYQNIPRQIKDMFPLFINYDDDNCWYSLEKINGLSLSDYYLSGIMTETILVDVMNSIQKIQSINIKDNKEVVNIYANYSEKLIERYNNYDYSTFVDSEKIFNEINNFLIDYEKNKKGKISVVHGDPVFTNILINKFNKIKFIDMRGKIGDKLTILGDWLYDWSKFYQSIIGYDKILMNKKIDIVYEKSIINIFEKNFVKIYSKEDLGNLKMITKSLLFTLIPLHDNEKCIDYYNLINTIM